MFDKEPEAGPGAEAEAEEAREEIQARDDDFRLPQDPGHRDIARESEDVYVEPGQDRPELTGESSAQYGGAGQDGGRGLRKGQEGRALGEQGRLTGAAGHPAGYAESSAGLDLGPGGVNRVVERGGGYREDWAMPGPRDIPGRDPAEGLLRNPGDTVDAANRRRADPGLPEEAEARRKQGMWPEESGGSPEAPQDWDRETGLAGGIARDELAPRWGEDPGYVGEGSRGEEAGLVPQGEEGASQSSDTPQDQDWGGASLDEGEDTPRPGRQWIQAWPEALGPEAESGNVRDVEPPLDDEGFLGRVFADQTFPASRAEVLEAIERAAGNLRATEGLLRLQDMLGSLDRERFGSLDELIDHVRRAVRAGMG